MPVVHVLRSFGLLGGSESYRCKCAWLLGTPISCCTSSKVQINLRAIGQDKRYVFMYFEGFADDQGEVECSKGVISEVVKKWKKANSRMVKARTFDS